MDTKKWMRVIGFGLIIWGVPFAEITEYISYNLNNSVTYGVSPWYKYILLILGILIPPISIVLLLGLFGKRSKLLQRL